MKERLRQLALESGFDLCRFTTAEPPASGPRFLEWLDRGFHADMAWMARRTERRLDPRNILPGARSIVVLGINYHPPEPAAPPDATPAPGEPRGRIARYARHADYHDVLQEPLRRLSRWIEEHGGPGTRALAYTDTGAILERDLAQRAGAGFIGKHTGLISRTFGNWLLLAEILTTAAFEPDPPEPNRCGSCTRCLAACPTAAIVAPFQLDARRCISYLTIEHRGSIPVELRPAIGDRIFGCDDCLEVCPWNRFAREAGWFARWHRPDLASPRLIELLALDQEAFRRRFRETPLWRTKLRGLRRNVCVALGNVGGPESLPALLRAAGDPDPIVAEHAQWAIDRIRGRQVGLTGKTAGGNRVSSRHQEPQA